MSTSCAPSPSIALFFFFNDTATTEIYTLSLHDALPISRRARRAAARASSPSPTPSPDRRPPEPGDTRSPRDRKSTRLNSSHGYISYAVFCLKKKNTDHAHKYLTHTPLSQDHQYVSAHMA